MRMNDNAKSSLAKTFTELAIQNGLIACCEDSVETAKEVSAFFNTIVDTIEGTANNE